MQCWPGTKVSTFNSTQVVSYIRRKQTQCWPGLTGQQSFNFQFNPRVVSYIRRKQGHCYTHHCYKKIFKRTAEICFSASFRNGISNMNFIVWFVGIYIIISINIGKFRSKYTYLSWLLRYEIHWLRSSKSSWSIRYWKAAKWRQRKMDKTPDAQHKPGPSWLWQGQSKDDS